jgi:hypothetical protein
LRRCEVRHELDVELLDLSAELEDDVVEPAFLVADVLLRLVAPDRGSTIEARLVVRLWESEHGVSVWNVRRRSTIPPGLDMPLPGTAEGPPEAAPPELV